MHRAATLALLFAAVAFSQAAANDYSKPENWLCRPNHNAACQVDLTATIVEPDGTLKQEPYSPASNPAIDCFYVYPTVSLDPSPNSDMTPGPEELLTIRSQFARFGSVCRLYAPIYRQMTLTAFRAAAAGRGTRGNRVLAFDDVAAAWKYYLDNENHGRGVVLIGHSQGSNMLIPLIRQHIDGKPVQDRIVSALLLGANVLVPKGRDVGGSFRTMPLCRQPSQTGCIISYVTYRATSPPTTGSSLGRTPLPFMQAACTNPAALSGGSGELKAYLPSGGRVGNAAAEPKAWVNPPRPITTPFVTLPGMLSGECVSDQHGSYLAVTVHGTPGGPRTDDIPGDLVVNGTVVKSWGLHLIDVNIAEGNLIDIVKQQGEAYVAAHAR